MERKVDGKLLLRSRPGAAAIAIVFLLGCGLSYVLHSSSSDLEDFAPISSGNSSAKGLIDDADLRRLAYIGERRCARAAMTAQSVRKFVIDRTFRGNSPWINFPPPHVASSLRPEYFVYWKSNVRTVYDNLVQQVGQFLVTF
ncbi:hypothetical protein M569_17199 [Genlisea aurea]|uniref:Uncharacterized protein n=1 Tax=Genlisea aurea TaxID=192259 RepID=S8D4L7_9LAMI|nr:hypothetical protein M569_17199 [Genlisea aurea]